MRTLHYNELRLVKYSRLIDKAIVARRYSLATQLAYRCLLEYHRLFLRFRVPSVYSMRKNAFQLSLEVVRHYRTDKSFGFRRSRQLFNLITTTHQLTEMSASRTGDRDLHVDLVTASYARDQSLAIAKFLMVAIEERNERLHGSLPD